MSYLGFDYYKLLNKGTRRKKQLIKLINTSYQNNTQNLQITHE